MSFLHLDLHHASWASVFPSFISSTSYSEYSRALSTALLRALRLSDWQRLFYGYLVPLLHDALRLLDVSGWLKVSVMTFLSLPSAGIASILCSASLVFITWLLSFCFSTSRCSTTLCETSSLLDDIDVEALHALQTIIIPTTSHWPPHYIALANRSRARSGFGSARGQTKTKTICVPLSALVRDVVQGDVELRNARRDLPALLMSTRTGEGAVVVAEGRANSMRVGVKLEVDATFWSEMAWGGALEGRGR